jgi:hypothetical protein
MGTQKINCRTSDKGNEQSFFNIVSIVKTKDKTERGKLSYLMKI